MLAVERDVKPRNMNFAKVEKRGGAINREGAFITKNTVAITHLWHAIEPQTMYHLIAKDKVAEQHILGKHSNCNSFGVTMALLNSQNFKVAITQLSKIQQV